jgi:hypothetical protein
MLPAITVTTTAVSRGRSLNKLNLALPTFVPRRSLTVAITPPNTKITNTRMYPAVIPILDFGFWILD